MGVAVQQTSRTLLNVLVSSDGDSPDFVEFVPLRSSHVNSYVAGLLAAGKVHEGDVKLLGTPHLGNPVDHTAVIVCDSEGRSQTGHVVNCSSAAGACCSSHALSHSKHNTGDSSCAGENTSPSSNNPGQSQHEDTLPKSRPGALSCWKNRTEAQTQANKLAQYKYRERKKKHVKQLQAATALLQHKMSELSALEAQAEDLERRNAELTAFLLQRETEALHQRSGAAAQHAASSSCDSLRSESCASQASNGLVVSPTSQASAVLDSEPASRAFLRQERLQERVHEFGDRVWSLQRLMYQYSVHDASCVKPGAATDLDPHLAAQLDCLLEGVLCACMQLFQCQAEDIEFINALSSSAPDENGDSKEHWLAAARALALTHQQAQRMLSERRRMLDKLGMIYAEREQLNVRMLRLAVPFARGTAAADMDGDTQQRLVAALEANLRAEQRAISEQDYVTFRQLLTPLQGAWFAIHAFPEHCDCMALLNAVHTLYGGQA